MVGKERQRSCSWFLDGKKENKLFVRFVFTSDGKGIEEFSVSYCTIMDDGLHEIVRYDCSEKETVHIHQFFRKASVKRSLDKEKSYETMQELIDLIEKNWRQYLVKFREGQGCLLFNLKANTLYNLRRYKYNK
jgi:hypothetical protein